MTIFKFEWSYVVLFSHLTNMENRDNVGCDFGPYIFIKRMGMCQIGESLNSCSVLGLSKFTVDSHSFTWREIIASLRKLTYIVQRGLRNTIIT